MGDKMTNTKKSVKKTNVKKDTCKCKCCKNGDCKCKNCKQGDCKCGCCGKDSIKYTSIFAAWCAFWRRGFTEWAGTSSRSEFWLSLLGNFILSVIFVLLITGGIMLDSRLGNQNGTFVSGAFALPYLYAIVSFIPMVSMLTRRMHDAGLSAWFWLLYPLSFMPIVGSYIWFMCVIVFGLLPTKTIDNPYQGFNKQ